MNESFYRACENLLESSHIDTSVDPPVLIPPTEEQLYETVLLAANEKYKIRIAGGGTLPVPHLTGRMVTVSLAGLSAVTEINPADFVVISQSGVIVDRAVEEAGNAKLYMPLDITSGSEATVGGAYMAGSAGLSSAR